jgi:opacity protein-like surface antigen
MKRIAIAAATALVMLGSAQAQTRSPLYGEVGYSFLEFKDDAGTIKVNPGAIRGIIGYEFHPNFAAEALLGFGVRSDSATVSGVDLDVKVRDMAGAYIKPKYDLGAGEVFARLGWTRTNSRVTASAGGASASGSATDSDFSYGIGANYRFNPRMNVGIDWMRYSNKDGGKIQGFTVSLGYHF